MGRLRRWIVRGLFALLVIVPLAGVAMYVANPFAVRSLDPRERLTGHGLYRVPSSNMAPGIVPGQVLITRAGHYARHAPQRGDVVTLLVPGHEGQVWLQRVIGLPGETIAIRDGVVHIDGRPLEEPYVSPQNARSALSTAMPPRRIPPGHYFMMGDNRDNSMDSRLQAPTRREDITGKLVGRLP